MLKQHITQYTTLTAPVPLQWIGPVLIHYQNNEYLQEIPLATYEGPLWPSVSRGAAVCNKAGGISVTLVKDCMTRSILLEAPSSQEAVSLALALEQKTPEIIDIVRSTSRFALFDKITSHIVGQLIFIRLSIQPGDASGHNMATKAADALIEWILRTNPRFRYVSISGNYCTDKKPSSVNSILGRGKYMIAEARIPRKLCSRYLKTTPEAIVDLNTKKNLIGSIAAGSIHSANAHFANMLLALYLATGQDAANIVEGSQGISFAQMDNDTLVFTVTLPNLIVGTIGNGKDLPFVQENLKRLGCLPDQNTTAHSDTNNSAGQSSRKLAAFAAGIVLCGELSLLAAQTNIGELVHTHISLERSRT